MNFHLILFSTQYEFDTMSDINLKYSALSDVMRVGTPLVDIIRRNASKPSSAVKSSTISKWIALTARQVNKHIHLLLAPLSVLTYTGPR